MVRLLIATAMSAASVPTQVTNETMRQPGSGRAGHVGGVIGGPVSMGTTVHTFGASRAGATVSLCA